MKTDDVKKVGKHAFELAGLGLAPFRFVGASDNVIRYPDGSQRAGGSCDYCGTGIRLECHVISADGRTFKVGCNCIEKVGDAGLLKAYKTSPEYRDRQRAIRAEKAAGIMTELKLIIETQHARLSAEPHPMGYTDRLTGQPLSLLDYARWMLDHCGAAGRRALLLRLNKTKGNS